MLLPVENKVVNGSEYFLGILIIVVTAVGYRECFLANGGNNGVDFLPRVACLGWVVGWRILIPFAFIFIAYMSVVIFYTWDMSVDVADTFLEGQLNMFVTDVLTLLGEAVFWVFLIKNIRTLKHTS